MWYEGHACPTCNIGTIQKKTNRKTKESFYGCSNYPFCRFSCAGFPKIKIDCPRCSYIKNNHDKYYMYGTDGYTVYPGFRSREEWDNWDSRYARKIPYGIMVMQKTKTGKTYYACSTLTSSPYHIDSSCNFKASYIQIDQDKGEVYARGHRAPQFRGNYMQERREEMMAQGYTHEEIQNECGDDVYEEVYRDIGLGDFR